MTKILPVILSGGAGSRLWPLSRQVEPKQLLPLLGESTMIEDTVARFQSPLFEPPVFICNAAHQDAIAGQMKKAGYDISGLIIEPVGRNTAPCAAVASLFAASMASSGEDAPLILLVPADHYIARPEAFTHAVEQAVQAAQAGHIVTFGIAPDGPETGYGYIERGQALKSMDGFAVKSFKEKPDLETAQTYLASGQYDWNGGIFLFSSTAMIGELSSHAPAIMTGAKAAFDQAQQEGDSLVLNMDAFAACPSESIDYAVMEHTQKAAVMPVDMGWNDIGSYASLYATRAQDQTDAAGNVIDGDVLVEGSEDNLILSDGPLVSVVGLSDIAVIVKDGRILVTDLKASQKVKEIVGELKTQGRSDDL